MKEEIVLLANNRFSLNKEWQGCRTILYALYFFVSYPVQVSFNKMHQIT
jgi:hypothetical protein